MNLPSDYRLLSRLDLTSTKNRLQLGIGIGSLLALVAFGWLFLHMVIFIRPEFDIMRLIQQMLGMYGVNPIRFVGALFAILFVMVCLHEALHGLVMWVFTRKRPRFGFKIHPYAALAPNAYASRNQGIFTSLAPLIIVTGLGIPVLLLFPASYLWMPIVFMSFNGAASVGDIILVTWLLKYSPNTLWGADKNTNVIYGSLKP